MSIELDYQFREQIAHRDEGFPISFFHDELALIPNWSGPLHWHPEFEIATVQESVVDFQVGQEHLTLHPGDSIFVNENMLHSIRQIQGVRPDPVPNIVFAGTIVAPEDSTISRKYIQPVRMCTGLPFVLFRHEDKSCAQVHEAVRWIYSSLEDERPCHEMTVQRNLNTVFEYLALHLDTLPRVEASRVQISMQVRIQQMLAFIHEHYAEDMTLNDIARSANISRSEAGRCFKAYMGCSPVDALIQFRLRMARDMLRDTEESLSGICFACGFHSANYFSRQFRRYYGCSPREIRNLGK